MQKLKILQAKKKKCQGPERQWKTEGAVTDCRAKET